MKTIELKSNNESKFNFIYLNKRFREPKERKNRKQT